MNIDVKHPRGIEASSSTGLTSDVLPEAQNGIPVESSQTGVSTNNALFGTGQRDDFGNKETPHL